MSGTIEDDLGRLKHFPDVSENYVPPTTCNGPTFTVTLSEVPRQRVEVCPITGRRVVVSDTVTIEWVERNELVLRRDEVARWESEGGR